MATHPEYHKKVAELEEKKQRNLLRAKGRLHHARLKRKNYMDADIQTATESLFVRWFTLC